MDKKDKKEKAEESGEDLEKKLVEIEDQLRRAVADYRNLEKRMLEERKEFIKYANRELLLNMLPSFDPLFLASKFIKDEGLRLSLANLLENLREQGVERIETEGKEFTPELMEGIESVAGAKNKVIEETRPGFTLYGKLLRPAQVKVGRGE